MAEQSLFDRISELMAPMTPRGHAVLFLSASLLAAGLLADPGRAPALMSAGLALLLLVVVEREVFLARVAALSRIDARWVIEHPLVEGRPSLVKLVLENRSLTSIEHLEVYDSPPRLFHWADEAPPRAVMALPAMGVVEVSYTVVPVVGRHEWGGPLRLVAEDILGFFRAERLVDQGLPIVHVQPRLLDVPRRHASLPTVLQPGGVAKLRRRGVGSEIMELREYTLDDDIRLVDWKASARAGHLMVKVFEQESVLRVAVVVDAHPSMFRGVLGETKIEYAARLAASIAEYLARRGDVYRVYIVDPGGRVYSTPWLHGRGSSALARRFIAEKLSWPRSPGQAPEPRSRASAIAGALLSTLPRGKTIVFLVSDFGEDTGTAETYAAALRKLQQLRHSVYVVFPLTTLFEARTLRGVQAAVYRLLAYERIKAYKEITMLLRRQGLRVAAAGPSDLLSYLLERLERIRGVVA